MQHRRILPLLFPLLVLAACGEDQSPTAPVEPGEMAESHTAGHKVVNSLADPGNGVCNATQCTLREAINDPASTEISFAPGLTGSIILAKPSAGGGTLRIDKTITITGPGTGIVIRRRSTDPAFRILRIGTGVNVRLTNLTIQNGETDLLGGGIVTFGSLALGHCKVIANSAAQGGGGIDNHGPLTLTNSTIADNSGGGIANHASGALTLTGSLVTRNTGRGIENTSGTLMLTRSTVSENSLGGIDMNRGRATLMESRIVANHGSGISAVLARVALTNSTVARNSAASGAGIFGGGGSIITIDKSTVVGNSAGFGGGGILMLTALRVGSEVRLTNSTVSGNSAREGGGIASHSVEDFAAAVTLKNSTVAFNSATVRAGGILNSSSEFGATPVGVTTLTNSLVALNTAPTAPDVDGTLFQARFSLIGDGTGSPLTNTDGNQVGNVSPNSSPIDPRIGPLALNGGPTRTHALLLGSPAIDAASTPDCPGTDQRGVLRPQGAACDIGSYERE